jgi:hypothetical protein
MTEEQYDATQQQALLFAGLVADLPLEEFLALARRAYSIGPFVDPTLWRAGRENLGAIIQVVTALREFQTAVLTVRDRLAEAPAVRGDADGDHESKVR